jgi:hypothetical protein
VLADHGSGRDQDGGGRGKKLIEVAQWRVDQQPNCATCKSINAGMEPPQDPPCETCRPVTLEENEEAISLYSVVQNQWIMGPGGPVDINHVAVWEAIDRCGAQDGSRTFRKILALSKWMLARINEKNNKE